MSGRFWNVASVGYWNDEGFGMADHEPGFGFHSLGKQIVTNLLWARVALYLCLERFRGHL